MKKWIFIYFYALFYSVLAQETKPQYRQISCFDENGIAKVSQKGLYGIIDKRGKERVPFQYELLRKINSSLKKAKKKKKA